MTALHAETEHAVAEQATSLPHELRSERRQLRLTPREDALIRQAAQARRMSVTEFMVAAAVVEAERAIVEPRRLTVTEEVYNRLVQRLNEPAEVSEGLARLFADPK
jgi:uncharacterized protein (DUF1778 family)